MSGLLVYALLAFPYYWLFDTRQHELVVTASVLGLVAYASMYGPLAACVSSLYTGQVRFKGVSLSYHLAAAIGGGAAPLIAGYLLAATRSSAAIAAYIVLSVLVGLVAAGLLRDRSRLGHSIDYDVQTHLPGVPTRAPAPYGYPNGAVGALP